MKFLLLDIDGVLNDHTQFDNKYCNIQIDKAKRLDKIVTETGCKIIIVSAWRYLILNGHMTLQGFRSLLMTHGIGGAAADAVVDHIPPDGDINDPSDRGRITSAYVNTLIPPTARTVVVDDLDLGYAGFGLKFHRTASKVGLTDRDTERIIAILNTDVES